MGDGRGSRRHAAARPPDPLLAVLAFDNLSNDPEMQFFSDGVSEEIIQRLARGARLKVIGRTSSFQFRGDRKAEAAQAPALHPRARRLDPPRGGPRAGQRAPDGGASQTTLWSDRYDRGLEDIFAVQDEISESIARALDQAFAARRHRGGGAGRLRPLPALEPEVLRARRTAHARRRAGAGDQRAPQFAAAWGRLAYLRAFLRFYQPFAERAASAAQVNARSRARAVARRAEPRRDGGAVLRDRAVRPLRRVRCRARSSAPRTRHRRRARYIGWALRHFGWMREALEEPPSRPTGSMCWIRCRPTCSPSRAWRPAISPTPFPCSRNWWSACPR